MVAIKGWWLGACGLGLLAFACGDDPEPATPEPEASAGTPGSAGAPALPESFPPALGPEDCASAVSELTLSQPEGADVWGGITLLEFQVEGARARNFETQLFDPDTEAWINDYLPVSFSGQRADGSYALGVGVTPREGSQDSELRLRVRPVQSGCPEADWVESEPFVLGSPIEGTSWHGTIPGDHFDSTLRISSPEAVFALSISAAELDLSFGDDGVFSQTWTLDLSTADNGPYDGCTLAFTFEGSWRHELAGYGGGNLYLSHLTFVSSEGTTCEGGPSPDDMLISDVMSASERFVLGASTQYLNVDYTATLSKTPGLPRWSTNLGRDMLSLLPEMLAYEAPDVGVAGAPGGIVTGETTGYVNVSELEVEKQ